MKKVFSLLTLVSFALLISCSEDNDDNIKRVNATLNFTHNWDGTAVTNSDFNTIQYTNANGDMLSIERLRYLVSNVTFTKNDGEIIVYNGYNLVDVTTNENLSYSVTPELPEGTYANVAFTFGFSNEDNTDGAYTDLNSASFNVPMMLGGGYHYMQFDGKYLDTNDNEMGFNYHAIRAVDNPGDNPTFPQDTFFTVNLGQITITDDATIEVQMNIAEWFKDPNTWNLNVLNTVLMPNSSAQIMMYENGQSVFSLGAVSQ